MTTDMSGRAVTAASERASMPFPGASPATCTSMFSGASVFNANVASWNTARVANLVQGEPSCSKTIKFVAPEEEPDLSAEEKARSEV